MEQTVSLCLIFSVYFHDNPVITKKPHQTNTAHLTPGLCLPTLFLLVLPLFNACNWNAKESHALYNQIK